ncbi:MAG: IS30 family transposase [Bdellovibrionota bacterium]|nr:IS30 family transposase [Bdellovibrionota bacterium]
MSKFNRLSLEEREEISRLEAQGESIRSIGKILNRSPSTICREFKRNRSQSGKYRAVSAQKRSVRAASSRKLGRRKLIENSILLREVLAKLRLYWSPEQIAVYLKRTYNCSSMHISKESIYSYLYVLPRGGLRKELTDCLRRQHVLRRKQHVRYKGQTANLEDMLSIEERPAEVSNRCVPGHWEGDMIIGGATEQTALGTLVERTTRWVFLVPLKNKTAAEVRKAFAREIKKLPREMRKSLTYDQGREMAEHKLFTKDTGMQVYFAHPKSPWERGTNENTNALIRQYFPKDTNFNEVSRYYIKKAQMQLNQRPRKTLNWKTPAEAMQELLQ